MDVRVLRMFVTKENTYFVEILVSLKESNETGNASHDIRTTKPFLVEGVTHTDGNEFLGKSKIPNAKMYLSYPWKSYISHVGQDYEGGTDEFRLKLCKYAVEMGFEFEYVANENKKITASCIKKDIEGCPWHAHASICSASHFVIRTLNNQHTYTRRIRECKSGMMTSKIVCSILVEQVRSNPHSKSIQIVDDFKKNYGLAVSYYNARYEKKMAMTIVHGDDILSYQRLGWYVEEIRKSNPRCRCVLEYDPNTSHFRRLFIAFRGSIVDPYYFWMIKKGGGLIDKFLEDLPKENYSDAFFLGARYGEMWSNVAESFNSWIRKERLLPIFQLVESIRVKLMVMNVERRITAEKWNSYLCPEMENQLDKLLDVGRHWHISRSSEFVFEVRSDDLVTVELEKWYCSCCQWQIKGFPCLHAVAAIMHNGSNPYDCIEDYFTADYYKSSYSFPIEPIPDIHQPPPDIVKDFVIKSPVTRKQPGKPRVKMIKSNGEKSRPMKCERCKKLGHHNKNTCSAPF